MSSIQALSSMWGACSSGMAPSETSMAVSHAFTRRLAEKKLFSFSNLRMD